MHFSQQIKIFSLSVLLWISLLVLLVNEDDFVVNGGPQDLKTLNVQFRLPLPVKALSSQITAPHLRE